MSLVKYRLREVASDFGVAPKEIVEIVSKFSEKPKSNTQVLTDEELNCVFDYITQANQIKSLEQVFAVKAAAPAKAEEPKKTEAPKAAAPAQQAKPQQSNQNQKPAAQQQNNKPQNQPQKAAEPERKRERRVVDTSAVQVNTSRFDDVDNLMNLSLMVTQEEMAKDLEKRFQKNAEHIYITLINTLLHSPTEEKFEDFDTDEDEM